MDIEEIIKRNLEEVNYKSIVEEEVKNLIDTEIRKEIKRYVPIQVQSCIDNEVIRIMENPIDFSDGYSQKKYTTFQELFKSELKDKMSKDYSIKESISRVIREKMDNFFQQKFKEISQKIIDTMMTEINK